MSDEIKARRQILRSELAEWIEVRIPELLAQIDGPVPTLPVVEDFRLLICIADGSDADAPDDWYPVVSSGHGVTQAARPGARSWRLPEHARRARRGLNGRPADRLS
jgi:hypothetical protein